MNIARVVLIDNLPVYAYTDEEYEALLEIKSLLETSTVSSCRRAMFGLYILMHKRRAPPELVKRVDKLLADLVRNDECRDI